MNQDPYGGQFQFPYAVNTHYISGPNQDEAMNLGNQNYMNYMQSKQGGGGDAGSKMAMDRIKAGAGRGAAATAANKAAGAEMAGVANSAVPTATSAGTAAGAEAAAGGSSLTSLLSACCFIFLESYNGQLPWWVRQCRDTLCTPDRVRGYRSMAGWLVPLMRRYAWVKGLVNTLMVAPLTAYGGWLWKVQGYEDGRRFALVVRFWFTIWDIMGKVRHD